MIFIYDLETTGLAYAHKKIDIIEEPREPRESMTYNLNWYVIGETSTFPVNTLQKVTVWDKDYVVWKDKVTKTIYAMDDDCSHKGAALSGGYLHKSCVVCPYHGYEFTGNGTLVKIPGLEFESSPCKNQRTYSVKERNGWIFLNTDFETDETGIFEEQEANNPDFSVIFLNVPFR